MAGHGLLTGSTASNGTVITSATAIPITSSEALSGVTISGNDISFTTAEAYMVEAQLFSGCGTGSASYQLDLFDRTSSSVIQSFQGTSAFGSGNFSAHIFQFTPTVGHNYNIRMTASQNVSVSQMRVLIDSFPAAAVALTFDAIGSGTNTTATMTVGAGAIINVTGTGVIGANTFGSRNTSIGTGTMPVAAGAGDNDNTAIGFNALNVMNGTASGKNTAVGSQAGLALTTAVNDTFIGAQAGKAETTGGTNTYVGSQAGIVAAGANDKDNTFVGYNTGAAVNGSATGANVIIGSSSGGTLTTGASNVIIGKSADTATNSVANGVCIGASAVVGVQGVVIGQAAGKAGSSGARNVLIGMTSGTAITSSSDNTFIGDQTGKSVAGSTDSANTFIGSSAGLSVNGSATGANVIIGALAGGSLTTGSSNVFIGKSCATTNITSGVSNVVIGANAVIVLSSSQNAVIIGASSFGGTADVIVGQGCGKSGQNNSLGNVVVGAVAFTGVTAGAANVVVGNSAGTTLSTGSNNIFIGGSADAAASGTTGAIVFGKSAKGDSNDFVAGSNTQAVSNVYFGQGKTAAASTPGADWTLNGHGGGSTTSNQAGGNILIAGGKGTGNAEPGLIQIQYPLKVASGTTVQALSTNKYPVSTCLATSTATTTVSAATVNTTPTTLLGSLVGTQTIEGGLLRAGRAVRLKLCGSYTASAGPTSNFKINLGATNLAASGTLTLPAFTTQYFEIDVVVTCRIYGSAASSSIQCDGKVLFDSGLAGTAADVAILSGLAFNSIDLTTNQTLDATVTYSANTAGNAVSIGSVIIEYIN